MKARHHRAGKPPNDTWRPQQEILQGSEANLLGRIDDLKRRVEIRVDIQKLQSATEDRCRVATKIIKQNDMDPIPPEDIEISLAVLEANPGKKGYRMLLWALLNTREFMFIQ